MARKQRLDVHLLTKGLALSRQQAQNLIRAGKVSDINGRILDKPGFEVSEEIKIKIKSPARFVSRGGEKLISALNHFPIEIEGRICLDCGISTGGFTDCLLQYGAEKVYGIDVGYGQTAWKIRQNPKVILKERTNIRYLTSEKLYEDHQKKANFVVADLSFISLSIVLPAINSLISHEKSEAILLVKPQFEVGRNNVGKGGIVKDPYLHIDALNKVIRSSRDNKWIPMGLLPSPITGASGNQEYLLWLGLNTESEFPNIRDIVLDIMTKS